MAAVFDPSQPFEVVQGETLDSLIAPRAPIAPPVPPAAPVFDPAKPFTPIADAPQPTGPVFDPSAPVIKVYGVEEFAAKSVDELLADKDFMPVQFGVQHDLVDPALRSKLEEVYAARERAGTSLKDKVKSTFTGIVPAVKTLAEGVKSAAKLAAKFTPAGIAKRVIEGTPQEVINDYAKSGTEAVASVELAALGSTDLIRRSKRAVEEGVANLVPSELTELAGAAGVPGVRRSKADMTEGDWRNRLSDDIAAAKQVEVAGAGNGEVMQAFGIDAATLEKDFGVKVDPEEIARLSVVTDPINYVPLGATVGAVTKLGGKAVRLGVAATRTSEQAAKLANILNTATAAASGGAAKVAGATAKGVGGAIESAGIAAQKTVTALGGGGTGAGLGAILGGNVYSVLGGATLAKAVPKVAQVGGRTLKEAGKILTGEAAAPAALTLAGDTLKAGAAGAVKGAVEGGALILPFEIGARPEEEEQLLGMVGLGAGLRGGAEGVRPGARAAGRAAQNKLAETIFQTVEQQPLAESPTYGTDSLLDSNHAANVAKISPREQKLVAWGRELLRQAGGEVYVLDTPTFAREAQGNKTARGYAVSIGETVAPDGSAKPLFRILLNRDAEALPHEFFHALTDLDPKRAADFRDVVQKSLTPDQLRSFEQLYNSLRNDGLPEVQWKTRLTPEQVANEAAAETFSRIFLAQDLSGVAPSVQNKAALFVSSLLEKLGAPLAKVGANPKEAGVSSLGVRPGTESVKVGQAWVKNMLQRVNDEGTLGQPPIIAERPATQTPIPTKLVSQKPAGAKPVPAAPVPVPAPVNPPLPAVPTAGKRNIRTTRAAQDDFAGQRAEVTGINEATAAAEATGDAAVIARTAELSQILETGNPVLEIEHSGAKAAGTAEAPSGRSARRAEIESGSDREAHQKTFIITRLAEVGKKPFVFAMSLDKVLQNRDTIARLAPEGALPYPNEGGRFSDATRQQINEAISAYADNQANGFKGDGTSLIRPAEDIGISIPAENPNYTPRPLTEAQANFVNLLMGTEPFLPRTSRAPAKGLPGNVKGQILAEVNARQPETPSVIRPEDITKQEFKSVEGRSIAEMNPLRNGLSAAGVPVRELMDVNERIRIADITSVKARPELDFKAPVTDTIRGGFLPGDTAKQITDVQAMNGEEFAAASRSWDGGLTKQAWKTGLDATTPADVAALKAAQLDASTKSRAAMKERDFDTAAPLASKSQFFREAYEAATDTGSAAGEIGWRVAFPDREAPFPEAKAPTGAFLPGSRGFKKWAGKAKVKLVGDDLSDVLTGKPVVIEGYHGTTHVFDKFDPTKGSIESDFGAGIYISTSPEDVAANYAGLGPDLKSRIERLAESLEDETTSREAALKQARQELTEHGGATLKVYTKLENPLVLGDKEPFWELSFDDETGELNRFHVALQKVSNRFYDAKFEGLPDTIIEGAKASDVIEAIKESEGISYATDADGNLASSEIVRQALEEMGFDGIIDRTVNKKFGYERKIGQAMAGIDYDTAHVIAFRPEQVKSATGNRGTFNPKEPRMNFLPAEPFYSELQRVIDEKVKGDSIPAAQLGALVRNAGIKPEELKWSGLDDYLAGKSKVSVPELKKFLAENSVQLEEVVKSQRQNESQYSWDEITSDEGPQEWDLHNFDTGERAASIVHDAEAGTYTVYRGDNGRRVGRFSTLEQAMDMGNDYKSSEPASGGTKFENYQVPGGENYRELLLTLPNRPVTGAKLEVSKPEPFAGTGEAMWGGRQRVSGVTESTFTIGDETGRITFWPETYSNDRKTGPKHVVNSPNLQNAHFDTLGQAKTAIENSAYIQEANDKGKTFQSSHFDEPNVLAHVRFNERLDAEGGRVLFLEEVQSDWHQKGKREGYKDGAQFETLLKQREGLKAEFDSLTEWFDSQETQPGYELISFGGGKTRQALEKNAARVHQLSERLHVNGQLAERLSRGSVPDAPFKKTWPLLAVKRMLRYAAENGFDKLAWTTGDIQAARYDLSKQVDSVAYNRGVGEHANDYGIIVVGKDGGIVYERSAKAEDLPDLIGKELAQKIVNGEGKSSKVELSNGDVKTMKKFSGLDLKVGGEGMRGFYDQILPKEVGAYVKKWGAKVEKIELDNANRADQDAAMKLSRPNQNYQWRDSGGHTVGPVFSNETDAHSWRARNSDSFDAWSVTLTPSMRTDVLTKGQKLFLPGGEATGITPDSIQRRGAPATPLPPLTADDLESRRGR